MALCARKVGMGAGQRKFSLRRMVKCRAVPIYGRMALGAILRKCGRRVRWIVCSLPVLQMAGNAIRTDGCELTIRVALRTVHADMRSGERKLREVVIESRVQP